MKHVFIVGTCFLLLLSCSDKNNNLGKVEAYVPVYSNTQDATQITWQSPQAIVNGGKIASIGNRLYQVETDKGIHVVDISTPAAPVKIGFIKNSFCRELTLKGNYIYTNNLNDLVVLDVSNPNIVVISSRIANAFPDLSLQFPPCTNCYFECADPAKGAVIQWNKQQVDNPKCKK
jgi:hypothetical protein